MLNEGTDSAPVQKYLIVEPTRKVSDPNCWHCNWAVATCGNKAARRRVVVERRVFIDQVLLLLLLFLVFVDGVDPVGGNDVHISDNATMLCCVGVRISIRRTYKMRKGGKEGMQMRQEKEETLRVLWVSDLLYFRSGCCSSTSGNEKGGMTGLLVWQNTEKDVCRVILFTPESRTRTKA